MEIITDMNNLYEAFKSSMKCSHWKDEPQRFEIDFLSEISCLKFELENGIYKTLPASEFDINERGKIRHIHGCRMRDRVVRHVFCDYVLTPALQPYLIYNNGASQVGKGISFTRKQFERLMHNYYLKYGDNNGYVLFIDFSRFYDNIPHDGIIELIEPHIDPFSVSLLKNMISNFRVDVSYMSDEEYANCMEAKFNSVDYYDKIPVKMRTGEKFMSKSVEIGDPLSQNIGIFYPTKVDNYICNVLHLKEVRYMDDIAIIHNDKEYLKDNLYKIYNECEKYKLFINKKKTRICKLSDTFTYLQTKYFLDQNGKVVKRITPKAVTRERRRLKSYKTLMHKGMITYDQIEEAYKSWMGNYYKTMSNYQIKRIKQLYFDLYGKDVRWKTK